MSGSPRKEEVKKNEFVSSDPMVKKFWEEMEQSVQDRTEAMEHTKKASKY